MAKRKAPKLKLSPLDREFVSDKIRTLVEEGKPHDQAVAIALDMARRAKKKG